MLNHTYNQRILAISIGKTKQPLPPYSTSESVHPIREVIPVHNVEITLRVEEGLEYRVYSPLRKKQYNARVSGNKLSFTIDQVGEYDAVIIEPRK